MSELIVPPKAQRAWIDYLQAELYAIGDAAVVSDTIRNVRCVRVVKSGGGEISAEVLHRPQLTIETADTTSEDASDLLDLVSAIILAARNSVLPDGSVVYGVDPFGDGTYNPSPDGRQKWTRTFGIGMRATTL